MQSNEAHELIVKAIRLLNESKEYLSPDLVAQVDGVTPTLIELAERLDTVNKNSIFTNSTYRLADNKTESKLTDQEYEAVTDWIKAEMDGLEWELKNGMLKLINGEMHRRMIR